MEAAVNGHQPAAASVIGPAVPAQRQAGAAEEDRAGGSGAGVALALEGVRRAFDEAEAFVDKVCAGWSCVWFGVLGAGEQAALMLWEQAALML